MAKMWAGRTAGDTSKTADEFNSSIGFDSRMYKEDITGSVAHARMLAKQGIISAEEADVLCEGLAGILEDISSGKLVIDENAEDIHMFVEEVLTKRVGDVGKKLHTARSRNDQVALDLRMYLMNRVVEISERVRSLIDALTDQAELHKEDIMPGYTHLQRAQPILFGHHLMAYAMMLLRDKDRLSDCKKRMNVSPIGCCALAGTTYDTDRYFEAEQLGFDDIALNSLDGVSDRDFVVELLSDISILMMHLSRLSEEIILWSSWEFGFVELSDAYTTGSSIMPQKKNSDMAELVRGKTGRVYGDLMAALTMLKGLPLAYNKDMQEDKEPAFDAIDTAEACISLFSGMLSTITFRKDVMRMSAVRGFTNATDAADYLVVKGVPFRDAHGIIGRLVLYCIDQGKSIDDLKIGELKSFSEAFDEDVYEAISLKTCVEKRLTLGAPGSAVMDKVIEAESKWLSGWRSSIQ